MAKLKFFTHRVRPNKDEARIYDPHSDVIVTEKEGYVSKSRIIQQMMIAGERLEASRNYDYQPEELANMPEEARVLPTNRFGVTEMDMIDEQRKIINKANSVPKEVSSDSDGSGNDVANDSKSGKPDKPGTDSGAGADVVE